MKSHITPILRSATLGLSLIFASIPSLYAQPGTLDVTYAVGSGANNRVNASFEQPDGKVVIGGLFTTYDGVNARRIARLTTAGSIDPSFNTSVGASGTVNCLALQPDGKILVAGQFTTYNGVARNRITRLNADGTQDLTFLIGTGANGNINGLHLLPSGKIIITGAFVSFNGVARNRIARLNSNGTLDLTYVPGVGPNAQVLCSASMPDGRIFIGGSFTMVGTAMRSGVARLDASGSVDLSFATGTGLNAPPYCMAVQDDGSLIAGGAFTQFNTINRARIARILPSGALDLLFKPMAGFNSMLFGVTIAPDGKVICGGDFTSYNGTMANRIARLNSDGSLDINFNTGAGCDNWMYSATCLADGDIVIGGGFASYNGVARGKVAKIKARCHQKFRLTVETDANGSQSSWEIYPEGVPTPQCSAYGLPNNATYEGSCCVEPGSYTLKVMDSAGNGITNGGYVLRNKDGQRIIDNSKNFTSGSVSAIRGGQSFSTEMGTDSILLLRQDKLDWKASGEYLVCYENPLVSAQYGVTNSTSGYEFWFFDPNGSYSFRRFLSHADNDFYGAAQLKACHMLVNNWAPAQHIPTGLLINVRVRGRVAGVPLPWGPACRMKIDPVAAACPSTKLVWDPSSIHYSCGVTRTLVQKVTAQPLRGANKYKFKFVNVADGYSREVVSNNYVSPLNFGAPALVIGRTYQVSVSASFNNGSTYCPYGESCAVTIASVSGMGTEPSTENPIQYISVKNSPLALSVWPNPSDGRSIQFSLGSLQVTDAPIALRVIDATGRTVQQKSLTLEGTMVTSTLMFDEQLAYGTYLLEATKGEFREVFRFMVAY